MSPNFRPTMEFGGFRRGLSGGRGAPILPPLRLVCVILMKFVEATTNG